MANKYRMELTLNSEVGSIASYSGFEDELQFNSTVLGEKNAPTASRRGGIKERQRIRLDSSEAPLSKSLGLLAEMIAVDENRLPFVEETAEFPEGFEENDENVPPPESNGDPSKSKEHSVNINFNEELEKLEDTVLQEDLFSDGNGNSYSRFTRGVPRTSTFLREPQSPDSPEPRPMEVTHPENTPTVTPIRRVLRSRNLPAKTTTAETTEHQPVEDSGKIQSDEEEPQIPPQDAQNLQNERAFTCTRCPKRFKSKNGKQFHEYSQHMTSKDLKKKSIRHWNCCSKIWIQKSHYEIHLLTHNGIKPHECSDCPQKFSRKDHLNIHVKTVHLKQKDFNCTQCNYKCGHRSNLKTHFDAIHLGIKHECPSCKKKFNYKSDLTKHGKNCRE